MTRQPRHLRRDLFGEGARWAGRLLVLASVLLLPDLAHSCASCFGEPDSPETRGLMLAGAILLSVVAAVQLVLARFFWRLLSHERREHHGTASPDRAREP